MADLILRDIDPHSFRDAIVAGVVNEIRSILASQSPLPTRFVGRKEMAKTLGWSVAKLDRRVRDGAIPSMLDGNRRIFDVEEVVEAIKSGMTGEETGSETSFENAPEGSGGADQ